MNRKSKPVTCALVIAFSLSLALTSARIGPFSVDVVSAATEAVPTPASPSTPTTPTTPTTKAVPTKSTYQNTSTSASKSTYSILTIGSTGNNVNYLQSSLNKFGYKLNVDGIFGNLTLSAVKSFQQGHGLVVDGLAGPLTFAKLSVNIAAPVTPTAPAAPAAPAAPVTPVTPAAPVMPPDAISSASIVNNTTAFKNAISSKGTWIIATLKDLTFTEPLKLDGQFLNGKTDAYTGLKTLQRKIGLYTQDDKHVVTARFKLTAPSLTIMSANASIEHGTFKGDLFVSVPDFQLKDAVIDGNVYFTTIAAKSTFKMDATSKLTGTQILKMPAEVDAITSASLVNTNIAFETALSKSGTWIITTVYVNLKLHHHSN